MSDQNGGLSVPGYDPFVDTPSADLYDRYRWLRDTEPVYHNADRDVWCLSRYDDVIAADRDWETFSNEDGVDLDAPSYFGDGDFLDSDPPRHDRLREVVRSWFTREAIAHLEDQVDARATRLIGEMGSGPVDLARDFVWEIPIWVISRIMGIPEAELGMVHRWLTELSTRDPESDVPPPAAFAARDELRHYLGALAEDRRRVPADDLLTTMARAADSGHITSEELVGMSVLLFVAGSETTAGVITSGLHSLATLEHEQRALRDGEVDLPTAIEEMLRFDAPIQYLARTAKRDVRVHDTDIPHGARVVLLFGSANRDERRFPDPDVFNASRNPRRHVAFGNGIHSCLGQQLARLEARTVFRRFFDETKAYALTGAVERIQHPIVRAIVSLPADIELV